MATKRVFLDPGLLRHLYNEEHLGIDAIAAKLATSHGSVWRAMSDYGIQRRQLSEAVRKHKRTRFAGCETEKAYLIGLRLGDLWVHKAKPGPGSQTIVVSCHSSRIEQIKLVESLFRAYGHTRVTRHTSGTIRIMCYLDRSFAFLLPKEDKVPSWILRRPVWFYSFLAGYVDAEGSFCVDRYGRSSFQLKSYDINILKNAFKYLTCQSGLECNPPRVAQHRGSATGKCYKLNKDAWVFSIADQETLYRFGTLIAPHLKHAKRRDDLARAMKKLQEQQECRKAKCFTT